MIQQVLNKRFLNDLLARMQAQVSAAVKDDRRAGTGTPIDQMNQEEKVALLADINTAKAHAVAGKDPQDGRRSAVSDISLADQNTFIPRSAELSNLQSAIEQYFLEKRPDLVESPSSDDGRRGRSAPVAGSQLKIGLEYLKDRRLLGPFQQTDIGWINSLFAKGIRKFRNKHPFVERPAREGPIVFPDAKTRMIIFGDWGSGIPRAVKVSKCIRKELDEGIAQGLQLHVVHLGDVYYSGWEYEYKRRFLNDWPVTPGEAEKIGSFTVNGNHDMFSGGYAYYDSALADSRFAPWQGKSSLFHLANGYWQIFGLDTAHDDNGLKGDQPDWVRGAARKELKTLLLSHHQYCSSYEAKDISDTLIKKIDPVLKELDVAAWLWGHEHRCMTYKDVSKIRFPRCLGHGGVPVYQTHDLGASTPAPGDWEYRDYIDGGVELWAKFGFIVMDFDRQKINVRYMNEDGGEPDRTEIIE